MERANVRFLTRQKVSRAPTTGPASHEANEVNKPLGTGQCLQHARFGIGIATQSDESRTTIDFYEHGVKKFITSMLEVELISTAPPRPGAPAKPKGRKKEAAPRV